MFARAGKTKGASPKLAFLKSAVALGDDGIEQIGGTYFEYGDRRFLGVQSCVVHPSKNNLSYDVPGMAQNVTSVVSILALLESPPPNRTTCRWLSDQGPCPR